MSLRRLILALALAILTLSTGSPVASLDAQETHLLVIRGIAGDPEYRGRFHGWSVALIEAARASGVANEHIQYLAEKPTESAGPTGESRKEDVEAAFRRLAAEATPDDRAFIVLIGHGSFRDGVSRFNLPGPDLSAEDFSALVDQVPTRQIAFVNTASSSGEFVKALSGPGRVVVAATKSGGERNFTRFPAHFVAAYADDAADLDKNGRVSVLEAFEYARSEVERAYATANTIVTEHPVLDDDGDGVGSPEPALSGESVDGALASRLFIGEPTAANSALAAAAAADSVVGRLVSERAAFEEQVAVLRAAREGMDPEAYQSALEDLLIELALKNREIRQRTGGP
ncbi:MAG: hypothetical protein ACI9OJ_005027 [Myxococcota bacterium]|jgi:hypothetical protein